MRTACSLLACVLLGTAARADAPAEAVKPAVAKALQRIKDGAANYPKHRQCFSCHHQATALFTLTSARRRGIEVEAARLRELVQFTLKSFQKKEQIAKGQGIGGANTTAGYALAALAAADHPADDTTAALVRFLLARQRKDGAWPGTANRPPTEGSAFTSTALAVHGLRRYGPGAAGKDEDEMGKRVEAAVAKGRDWLLKNRATTTEDKVFRLRGLVWAAADPGEVAAARAQLLREQHADGSWSQLPDLKGDAYATGTALIALRDAGLPGSAPAYQKGAEYLLKAQGGDGVWTVQTRSRPIQIFFDNGDPGGKSQFITFAATGWAVLALLELYPSGEAGRAPATGGASGAGGHSAPQQRPAPGPEGAAPHERH